MTYSVTVTAGTKDVVLPNGNRYQGGAVVALSDDEYSELSAGALRNLISAASYLGQAVTRTIFIKGTASNVVLPNLQRYNGGASVTLSDAQYSTIDAAAKAAWFASDTAGGLSVPAGFATGTSFARLLPMLNTAVLAGKAAFGLPLTGIKSGANMNLGPGFLPATASFPAPSVQHNA